MMEGNSPYDPSSARGGVGCRWSILVVSLPWEKGAAVQSTTLQTPIRYTIGEDRRANRAASRDQLVSWTLPRFASFFVSNEL
jgi:hypothetical protein